ncbi:hypothetical protein P389DRAFT_161752 [Cystobasidium minutum MCA 4210]|uniref:uncharacterized protein n=1 Tax=Cystobasidium minutum MCA 4210 TaxID=1397322 RepID=UPI0034CFBAC5|eukprot:jgi/Rhomi1/161752/estExt_Genewise1Plus.C_5_t10222
MPVLDAASIDYSLLAGAETLSGGGKEDGSSLRRRREGVYKSNSAITDDHTTSTSSSSTSSASSASTPSTSDDEDEVQAAAADRKRKEEEEQELKSKYTFRTPKKVISQDPNDWLWMHDEEPHRSRRRAILKEHPEVTKLMGYEPLTKYVVLLVMAIQLTTAYLLMDTHPLNWKFVLAAYIIGGTANQNLFLAIHEITHNLAFRNIVPNRLFAMFANLPIGVPYAMMFKKYHMEHHRALGVDGVDTDLPTRLELMVLKNVAGKAFFCTFQILFYALRPGIVRSQKLGRWHFLNIATQLSFDVLVVTGAHNYSPLLYFIMSSFFAGSLHPCAGHFIAEHYLFDQWDQETWSYYGILNYVTYNVGYHNEHHDFPSIPWTRLPALNRIANSYYKDLPKHNSWCKVTFDFIFRTDVGLFSRVKRLPPSKTANNQTAAAGAAATNIGGQNGKSVENVEVLEDWKTAGGKGTFGGLTD